MNGSKPRIIKDYDKLSSDVQEQIKLEYPYGFSDSLITFNNSKGLMVSVLPFETDEKYFMVRMTAGEAIQIVEEDDDFDSDGALKIGIKEEYENKYNDLSDLEDELKKELKKELKDDLKEDGNVFE